MVRGYHVYQDIWDALIGEKLVCAREPDNLRDPFVVAAVKSDAALGGTSLASTPYGSGSLNPHILCILTLEVLQQSHGRRRVRAYVWYEHVTKFSLKFFRERFRIHEINDPRNLSAIRY